MHFISQPNLANWKKSYGFEDYCEEMSQVFKARNSPEIKYESYKDDNSYISSFEIHAPLAFPQLPIQRQISQYYDIVREIHEEVERTLLARLSSSSVVLTFNFPEEVKTLCEQYLIYFVQFLQDLGVSATSDLKHEAGQVLFTVIPTDPQEALHKIRMALEVYLWLPSNPISDSSGLDRDIVVQRLAANIFHLKSQLVLSQAMLQAKDATIQAQEVTINYQQRLLSGKVMIESLKEETLRPSTEDKEEVLNGIMGVKNLEYGGIELYLPNIVRFLKKYFNKE